MLAIIADLAALMAKETSYALPIVAAFVWWTHRSNKDSRAADVTAWYALSATILTLVVSFTRALGGATPFRSNLPVGERLLTFASVYVEYVEKVVGVRPFGLSDTVVRASTWSALTIANVSGVAVVLLALTLLAWKEVPRSRVWLVVFNAGLLPVCQIVPLLHFKSERFLYVSSFAFVCFGFETLMAMPTIRRLYDRPVGRKVVLTSVCTILVVCAAKDRSRVRTFSDDRALFGPEVAKEPRYREGLSFLGADDEVNGDLAGAAELYRRALAVDESIVSYVQYDGVVLRMSHVLLKQGRPTEVIHLANEWRPRFPPSRYSEELTFNEGVAYAKTGRFREALDIFANYSRAHPSDPDCAFLSGVAWSGLGEPRAAVAAFERYLEIAPNGEDRAKVEEWLRRQKDSIRQADAVIEPATTPLNTETRPRDAADRQERDKHSSADVPPPSQ